MTTDAELDELIEEIEFAKFGEATIGRRCYDTLIEYKELRAFVAYITSMMKDFEENGDVGVAYDVADMLNEVDDLTTTTEAGE